MRVGDSLKTKRCAFYDIARVGCVVLAVAAPYCGIRAQERVGGSLAVTSDYVYRGVSLSRGRVAYQAGAHVRLPAQWRIGVWGSTVEVVDHGGTPIETTAYISRAWTPTADWSIRASYTHYQYFGIRSSPELDYDEFSAGLSYRSQLGSQLALNLSWAPNAVRYGSPQQYVYPTQSSGSRASAMAVEASWLQPVWNDWAATVGAGYYDVSNLYRRGYAYWHLGVTGAIGPIEFDLLHINSDSQAGRIYGRQVTGERWSALARWRF
jgi:uncharacterized protein (TIGR02001 family)